MGFYGPLYLHFLFNNIAFCLLKLLPIVSFLSSNLTFNNKYDLYLLQLFLIEKIKASMLKLILVFVFLMATSAIPYTHQLLLANSLIVGRDDDLDLVQWTCKVCDNTNKPLRSHFIEQNLKDVKCILSVYHDTVILAFRYTNTAQNVWQDILYPLQVVDEHACKDCKVQKAYKTMWETIRANVTEDLVEIKQQTKINKLYITGISLGGGLASISFIDIRVAKIFDTIQVLTFGAPRVGNKNWANKFDEITNKKSVRYIVKGDPVVVLPKCLTVLCNYQHTGIQVVCVQADKICREDQNIPEQLIETNNLQSQIPQSSELEDFESIVDHIEGYPKIYNFTVRFLNEKVEQLE